MIDLPRIIDRFLAEAVARQRRDCQARDEEVIRFLRDRHEEIGTRTSVVRKWLEYYSTLQGYREAERIAVSQSIVTFADNKDLSAVPSTVEDIESEFTTLYQQCQLHAPKTKSEMRRDLTSLASKALWCCYPNTIPIYDGHAERALWAISRLLELPTPAPSTKYKRFLLMWLEVYSRVQIDKTRLDGYPHTVRVFDKILWILGQPDFGLVPH